MNKTTRLSTEGLAVGYGRVPLIKDIALHVKEGEILTLIGPNGSGKSTILKTLTGHLSKMGGLVALRNIPMERYSRDALAKELAVVLTERLHPELMTCEDVVAMGRYPYTGRMGLLRETDQEKINETLRLVEIEDIRDQDFMEISDGQRQRVLLARAICQQPKVLVLDEPTSFLDIHHKIRFLEVLRKLTREQGLAVVMSMHELDFAKKISDYTVCIKDGAILKAGPPKEILTETLVEELFELPVELYRSYLGESLG